MKTHVLILAVLFALTQAGAQTFTHEAKITVHGKSGLHKIALDATDKRFMRKDLRDMRILDPNGKEVPYVVLSEPLLRSKSDFVEYPIHSQIHHRNYSEVIIENTNKEKISNIAFNINNSDAVKRCAIEGSDDMKQWYTVSENQELSLAYNSEYTNTYKCIYFPLNNYRYFRLLIDDWRAEPMKINSAGYFRNSVIAGKLNEVNVTTSSEEIKKTTLLKLSFANNQQVDRMDFKIKDPRLFKRRAVVFVNREQKRKKTIEKYKQVLFEFDLSSDRPLWFDVPAINEPEVFIEIDNKDNPPLVIESVECRQLASYLICDLDSTKNYTLKCGNSELKVPEYDLNYFVSNVPQLLPEATLDDIKAIPTAFIQKPEETQQPFYETREFMWLCIGVGIAIVALFSASLLKEMKGNEKN